MLFWICKLFSKKFQNIFFNSLKIKEKKQQLTRVLRHWGLLYFYQSFVIKLKFVLLLSFSVGNSRRAQSPLPLIFFFNYYYTIITIILIIYYLYSQITLSALIILLNYSCCCFRQLTPPCLARKMKNYIYLSLKYPKPLIRFYN